MLRVHSIIIKTLKIALALLASWLLILSISIWQFGKLNQAQASDCIIVLGAAVYDNQPSPVFAERIRHAVSLYQQGFAKQLIFTGGFGEDEAHSESSVARKFAHKLDIPFTAILIEEQSHTTWQNLTEAAKLMQQHGLNSAILVSDPLHMKRVVLMAKAQNIQAFSSPTPSSKYRSWSTWLQFLGRELYFIHYYFFTGK